MASIDEQRAMIVTEARSWQFTPFHANAQVKGLYGGVDCGSLLKGVYGVLGVEIDMPSYSIEFFLHHCNEIYLDALKKYCMEINYLPRETPLLADIIIFKMGRAFGHAGIITTWPFMIHANVTAGYVHESHAENFPDIVGRERKFYSPKIWHP